MRAVNLIPSDQRSGASVGAGRSEGAAYAVLALLVAIAVLAVLYGKAARTVSSDKSKAATLSAEATRAQSEAQQLAPYTSFVALRKARQEAVETLVDQRCDWAHAIHEFGRVPAPRPRPPPRPPPPRRRPAASRPSRSPAAPRASTRSRTRCSACA